MGLRLIMGQGDQKCVVGEVYMGEQVASLSLPYKPRHFPSFAWKFYLRLITWISNNWEISFDFQSSLFSCYFHYLLLFSNFKILLDPPK